MTLIDDTGFVADEWQRIEGDAAPQRLEKTIWPLARLDEALATGVADIGVNVPNTTKPADLVPYFDRLSLISIAFPAFNDGRGFSIAKGLRLAGFKGELRVFGPLIADQYPHARACGFDTVEVPDDLSTRQPAAQWRAALHSLSLAYQRGYGRGVNILDQRRKARAASAVQPPRYGRAGVA
ncbi:MAG: DUF934 domain-containing protein [Beijerinckiaceae bacterium]|nr:DUF934 domain-containing protein [Beijerinckiaceae bacterium]